MGQVVYLEHTSLLDFEAEALRKLTALAEMTLKVPDLLAAVQAEPEPGAGRIATLRFLELMAIFEEAIDELVELAPHFVDLPEKWNAIFDLQCTLTNARIRAFATARCSILYINDFEVEGLDEAFENLGSHRRRLLSPPDGEDR